MTSASLPNSTEDRSSSTPNRNIFEDPAIQKAAESDPFARFLVGNWRSILMTLITIGAVMVAYNVFTSTALEKRAVATTKLADIQDSYRGLIAAQERLAQQREDENKATTPEDKKKATEAVEATTKEIDASRGKLSLMIDALDSPAPFDILARLYRGLLAGRFGDYQAVSQALSATNWEGVSDKSSGDRYVSETAALGLARSLAASDAHLEQARQVVAALAERGEYVGVDALSVLVALADTPERREAAKKLVERNRQKFPARDRYISEVAQRLE